MVANPKRRDLKLEVERIIAGCANADGEFNYDEARPVLVAFLAAHTEFFELERYATALLTEHRDAYKWSAPASQDALPFDLESGIYVLGDSKAVFQRNAKPA